MEDRYYLWLAARLAVGVALVAWAASYLGSGSGEKEFQKTLQAMKNVHTFRMVYTANNDAQHNDSLWEVDCDHNVIHHHSHLLIKNPNVNTPELNQDDTNVAGKEYGRKDDGSWIPSRYSGSPTAAAYCHRLTEGEDSGLLPQIATMIKRGIIQKGDKKTVNGVRCREWKVAMKGGLQGLEHDTVCIGLADYLPYEVTVDWEGSRASFSDYNTALRIDVPEAAVQTTSADGNSASN